MSKTWRRAILRWGRRKIKVTKFWRVNPLELLELPITLLLMVKALIWNIHGIGNPPSRDRVMNLCRIHNICVLVVLEPLISESKVDNMRFKLGFDCSFSNCTNKIWIFWKHWVKLDIIKDLPQIVHTNITYLQFSCVGSFVYASCSRMHRRILWNEIMSFA